MIRSADLIFDTCQAWIKARRDDVGKALDQANATTTGAFGKFDPEKLKPSEWTPGHQQYI